MNLDELIQDEKFRIAIEKATDFEEIAKLLQSKGIDVSPENVEEVLSSESGEMSEAELETVSGGGLFSRLWSLINALRYKSGGGGFSTGGGGNGAGGGAGYAKGGGR